MNKISLEEAQKWMKQVIIDPRGASIVLEEMAPSEILIDETPPLSAGARLDIYAEAYFTRIHEALGIDFSITKNLLEDDSFARLVAAFLKVYPSKEFNLNNISSKFPDFVKTYTDNTCFHDLVDLERLAVLSFYAEVEDDFSLESLVSINESEWGKLKFHLNPSVFFLGSSWPLDQLWVMKTNELEEDLNLEESDEKKYFLIYRERHVIKLLSLSPEEYKVLTLVKAGVSLDEIFPVVCEMRTITDSFNKWGRLNLFSGFYF